MGYQESFVYLRSPKGFDKLVRAYYEAKQDGYYKYAGAEPLSVVRLKQPMGDLPAGTLALWVCGDRGWHTLDGIFGDHLKNSFGVKIIPIEKVFESTNDKRVDGIRFNISAPSENEYMKRCSTDYYFHHFCKEPVKEKRSKGGTR